MIENKIVSINNKIHTLIIQQLRNYIMKQMTYSW